MFKIELGRISLPGGHERSRLSAWAGYNINRDDWRLSVGWGRHERRLMYRDGEREYPFRHVWSLPLPRWLGECLTCPAPKLSSRDETAAWVREEERRTGRPASRRWGFIDGPARG
jgi:hypothetical protein